MSGVDGALSTLGEGTIWLQMSSVGVDWAERLGHLAEGSPVTYVDAPVSGSVGPAEEGHLLILASGPLDARPLSAPILDQLGRRTYWLGEAGAAVARRSYSITGSLSWLNRSPRPSSSPRLLASTLRRWLRF